MDVLKISVLAETQESVTLALYGHLTRDHLPQLESLFADAAGKSRKVILDLRSMCLVDREAIRFLRKWEQHGVAFANCPTYVERWVNECEAH